VEFGWALDYNLSKYAIKIWKLGGIAMSAFLSSFASYLVKMIILVALGIMGGFIGVKLRQSKNRKEADSVSEVSSEE
jgi:hypothetical protein